MSLYLENRADIRTEIPDMEGRRLPFLHPFGVRKYQKQGLPDGGDDEWSGNPLRLPLLLSGTAFGYGSGSVPVVESAEFRP